MKTLDVEGWNVKKFAPNLLTEVENRKVKRREIVKTFLGGKGSAETWEEEKLP